MASNNGEGISLFTFNLMKGISHVYIEYDLHIS